MLNVTLRAATQDDSEFVFLVKKAALGKYVEQTWGWEESFQRQFHDDDYEPRQTKIIVESGQDVGCMVVAETDTEFQLQEIYLQPQHQSRGIGSHLIRLLSAEAERQRKPVRLTVLKVNLRARQLYERLGFEVVDETSTHYAMSTRGATTR
jgi:ribosomal protein S18 acetylase RimI-like enzyme